MDVIGLVLAADGDRWIPQILALIIFLVMAISAIVQAIRKQREEEEAQKRRRRRSTPGEGPAAAQPGDVQEFLDTLGRPARQTSGGQARQPSGAQARPATRRPPVRPGAPLKRSPPTVQRPQQPPLAAQRRSRERRIAQRPQRPPRPVRRTADGPAPGTERRLPAEPVARPAPVRSAPVPPTRDRARPTAAPKDTYAVRRKEPYKIAKGKPSARQAGKPSGREAGKPVRREERAAQVPVADAISRLDALLPAEPLKRAIALREVLGPCRATNRFLPGRW